MHDIFGFASNFVDYREEYLYDVIDISTGWVLTRTFKGDCTKFVNDIILKRGYYFAGEDTQDVGYNYYSPSKGHIKQTKNQLVGIYKNDNGSVIRAFQKYTVKEI